MDLNIFLKIIIKQYAIYKIGLNKQKEECGVCVLRKKNGYK